MSAKTHRKLDWAQELDLNESDWNISLTDPAVAEKNWAKQVWRQNKKAQQNRTVKRWIGKWDYVDWQNGSWKRTHRTASLIVTLWTKKPVNMIPRSNVPTTGMKTTSCTQELDSTTSSTNKGIEVITDLSCLLKLDACANFFSLSLSFLSWSVLFLFKKATKEKRFWNCLPWNMRPNFN